MNVDTKLWKIRACAAVIKAVGEGKGKKDEGKRVKDGFF